MALATVHPILRSQQLRVNSNLDTLAGLLHPRFRLSVQSVDADYLYNPGWVVS